MLTRIHDNDIESPCFFVVKKTWFIQKIPIPCTNDVAKEDGQHPSLAFMRLPAPNKPESFSENDIVGELLEGRYDSTLANARSELNQIDNPIDMPPTSNLSTSNITKVAPSHSSASSSATPEVIRTHHDAGIFAPTSQIEPTESMIPALLKLVSLAWFIKVLLHYLLRHRKKQQRSETNQSPSAVVVNTEPNSNKASKGDPLNDGHELEKELLCDPNNQQNGLFGSPC